MNELIKITYKGVKIEEVINHPKTGTYFVTDLVAHSDPFVRKVPIMAPTLQECKYQIDQRLKELEDKKQIK